MTRHDFTKAQRDHLNLAVSLGIVDAVELGCMMAVLGADFRALSDDLSEAAFAGRHCPEGAERHAKLSASLDALLAAERAAC
jgi:hypothetical protein